MMARFAKNITVCIENEEAAISLRAEQPAHSSSTQFVEFLMLSRTWTQREKDPDIENGILRIMWIPSH